MQFQGWDFFQIVCQIKFPSETLLSVLMEVYNSYLLQNGAVSHRTGFTKPSVKLPPFCKHTDLEWHLYVLQKSQISDVKSLLYNYPVVKPPSFSAFIHWYLIREKKRICKLLSKSMPTDTLPNALHLLQLMDNQVGVLSWWTLIRLFLLSGIFRMLLVSLTCLGA